MSVPVKEDWSVPNQAINMTAERKSTVIEQEDIDLLLQVERGILFLKRYRWIYIVSLSIGLLLGYWFYRSLPTVYSSRMLVHSFLLTNQEQIQIVNTWRSLLKKKEYDALAEAFNSRKDMLYRVKGIKAEEIQKIYTPNNPNGFIIEAIVTDNSVLPELQKGIVYGFENSEYVKERVLVKRANLHELIDKTQQEIRKLDSTKKVLDNILTGSGRASSSVILDAPAITRQQIDLNEKLLSLQESLRFSNAIEVLQSFNKFKKPSGPKLIVWLFIGFVFGLCMAFGLSFILSIRSKLKDRARLRTIHKV
jgi:hypothetical protein